MHCANGDLGVSKSLELLFHFGNELILADSVGNVA